jgi:hypothetical protein
MLLPSSGLNNLKKKPAWKQVTSRASKKVKMAPEKPTGVDTKRDRPSENERLLVEKGNAGVYIKAPPTPHEIS